MPVAGERKLAGTKFCAASERAAHSPPSVARTPINPVWQRLATGVQAKLAVSAQGDSYEREADQMAERVMRMPAPAVQGDCVACDVGGAICPKCRVGSAVSIQRQTEGADERAGAAPGGFLNKLSAGHSLDPATQAFMETRFGRDFGGVRAHTNEKAAESAQPTNIRLL